MSSTGKMGLKVNVLASGGPAATPVAEGALQGTFTDKFTVNGGGPTAATTITFNAHVTAPTLDFSDGDFYNYAVGYQMAVIERAQLPILDEEGNPTGSSVPGIREYWGDSGFYWMDARLVRNPMTSIPESIRIESLGDAPPGVEGVDHTKEVIDYHPTYGIPSSSLVPSAYKYIRNIAFDLANPASYDDPMMPFSKASESGKFVLDPITGQFVKVGDIDLPTGVELEMVVNFFVIAGCSDLQFASCEISIDGSNTAAVGIEFTDPTVTLTSQSGFAYPTTVAVPEPETYALMLGGLALLGLVARHRRRPVAN